jgi:response regulator NasT
VLKPLRDIRNIRVQILHPKDRECDELVAQIRRIGCHVEGSWFPQAEIHLDTDVAIVLFRQDVLNNAALKSISDKTAASTLIAIVESESPAAIEVVVRAGAKAVITKPIRAFGLLTSIIVARTLSERINVSSERITKLESRLAGLKKIEQAKSILMTKKGLSEQEAYDVLRSRAMSKRVSLETISMTIVEASDFFDP